MRDEEFAQQYANVPCVIPFKHVDELVTSCKRPEDDTQDWWCSIKVDEYGNHVGGQWGWCDMSTCKGDAGSVLVRNPGTWEADTTSQTSETQLPADAIREDGGGIFSSDSKTKPWLRVTFGQVHQVEAVNCQWRGQLQNVARVNEVEILLTLAEGQNYSCSYLRTDTDFTRYQLVHECGNATHVAIPADGLFIQGLDEGRITIWDILIRVPQDASSASYRREQYASVKLDVMKVHSREPRAGQLHGAARPWTSLVRRLLD